MIKKILFYTAIFIISIIFYTDNLFTNTREQAEFTVANKSNSFKLAVNKDVIYKEEFLLNSKSSKSELYAIDSLGRLTVNINNHVKGSYLPYASLLNTQEGYKYFDGRVIVYQKVGSYTIVYRGYITDIIFNNLFFYIILIISYLSIILFNYFNRDKEIETVEDLSINGVLRSALNELPEGVLVADRQHSVIYVNNSFTNILGWDKLSIKNKTIEDIVPKNIKEIHYSYVESFAKSTDKSSKYRSVKVQHKDNNEVNVHLSFAKFIFPITGEMYFIVTVKKQDV